MSDEEEDQVNSDENEEEEDEEGEGSEEEQGDEDQDEDEDEDEEDDDDEQGDEDEDEDGDQDQDQEGEQDEQQQQDKQQASQKHIPTFKPVPEQFTFKNLLSEIAGLEKSVDNFISTLPSQGGYRSASRLHYQHQVPKVTEQVLPPTPKYTIMKDEDTQVSMQPQIVIQQTVAPKEEPKKQPYKISNESTKFLAQLYEENKKLKRWHNTTTETNGWVKSRERFSRPEHQRGLINLEDRNKEIDEAIEMLRREDMGL